MNFEGSAESTWSTDLMRDCKDKWTLADDVSLLKYLEKFSESILAKAKCTLKSLDNFENALNGTCIAIKTVSNMFQALADTQFVENRVYDEEDHLSSIYTQAMKEEVNYCSMERASDASLNEALLKCLHTLDNKFETVQLSGSDSEGEEDNAAFSKLILKPVNQYQERPLPHLIGTSEFMDDDTLGLVPFSNEESENEDDESDISSQSSVSFKEEEKHIDQGKEFVENGFAQQLSTKLTNMQEPPSLNTNLFGGSKTESYIEKDREPDENIFRKNEDIFHDTFSQAIKKEVHYRILDGTAYVENNEGASDVDNSSFFDNSKKHELPKRDDGISGLFSNKNLWDWTDNDSIFDSPNTSLFQSDNSKDSKIITNKNNILNNEDRATFLDSGKQVEEINAEKPAGKVTLNTSEQKYKPINQFEDKSTVDTPMKKNNIFSGDNKCSSIFVFDGDLFDDDGDLFMESNTPKLSQDASFLQEQNDEFDDLFSSSILNDNEKLIEKSASNFIPTSDGSAYDRQTNIFLSSDTTVLSSNENHKSLDKFDENVISDKQSFEPDSKYDKNCISSSNHEQINQFTDHKSNPKSSDVIGYSNDQKIKSNSYQKIYNNSGLQKRQLNDSSDQLIKNNDLTWNQSEIINKINSISKSIEKSAIGFHNENKMMKPKTVFTAYEKPVVKELLEPTNVVSDDSLPPLITNTLHCLSKERAKIQKKRRLPSRKVRKVEKVQSPDSKLKSAVVLSPSTDEEDLFVVPALDLCKEKSSNDLFAGSVLLSPGTSIDNETASIQGNDKQIEFQKTVDPLNNNSISPTLKIPNSSLFQSPKGHFTPSNSNDLDDIFADNQIDEIFSSSPTVSHSMTNYHFKDRTNLKDEDKIFHTFEEDDLFGMSHNSVQHLKINLSVSEQVEEKSQTSSRLKSTEELFGPSGEKDIPITIRKKSCLFDDISEDEDIFSGVSIGDSIESKNDPFKTIISDNTLNKQKSPINKHTVKPIVQLQKKEVFHDPLMSSGDHEH